MRKMAWETHAPKIPNNGFPSKIIPVPYLCMQPDWPGKEGDEHAVGEPFGKAPPSIGMSKEYIVLLSHKKYM